MTRAQPNQPTLEAAYRVAGTRSRPMIRNMVQALSLHPWLNTNEETARLTAGRLILRSPERRDRRFS